MILLLNAAWAFCGFLKWGGLAIAFAGVALFGWYFVLANARAARNDTDNTASVDWGGPPAMRGVKLLVLGVLVQVAGFVLALMLPARL